MSLRGGKLFNFICSLDGLLPCAKLILFDTNVMLLKTQLSLRTVFIIMLLLGLIKFYDTLAKTALKIENRLKAW